MSDNSRSQARWKGSLLNMITAIPEDSACGEGIAAIEAVLPCIATKEDLEKLKSDLTWRIIIAMSILTAIFVAVLQLRGS